MPRPKKETPVVTETPVTTPVTEAPAVVETPPALPITGPSVDSWLVDFDRVPGIFLGTDPAALTKIYGDGAKSTDPNKRNHILWVLLAVTSSPTSARGLEYRKWVAANEKSLLYHYGKYICKQEFHDSSVMAAIQYKLATIIPTIATQWNEAFGSSVTAFGIRAAKVRTKNKEVAPVEFDL